MPHRQPIDVLRAELRQALELRNNNTAQPWGNPMPMHEMLASIKRDLGGQADTRPPQDKVNESLLHYQKTKELPSFNSLKYVCYGVTVPVGINQWRVIDNQAVFDNLLMEVRRWESQAKQFRRCYQGLLEGYLSFDQQSQASTTTRTNWAGLKHFLSTNLDPVLQESSARGEPPPWLATLAMHRNLLGDDPCSRYAEGFMRDDINEFRGVCATLGIPSNSWVWEDALMAYVRTVCSSKDDAFKRRLPNLLDLVNGKLDIQFPRLYATETVGRVLYRYSDCQEKPEHITLRDASLNWIGNPWLKRTAWDAVVKKEAARQMVESWLKCRLIKDFFELLAEDGAADLRRLNYWLKWEPHISDMWFVLGNDAATNRSTAFTELRKLMLGRDRILRDNNPSNNAFIMRIGQLLIIEFGITGNACYVFATSDFITDLEKKSFSIYELKQRLGATRLSHSGSWEFKFNQTLRSLMQTIPLDRGDLKSTSSPTINQIKDPIQTSSPTDVGAPKKFIIFSLCGKYGLEHEDNRSRGGEFWILTGSINPKVSYPILAKNLDKWGFSFVQGKGYWTKMDFQ
ncbi:EH signature domain-containing protein [Malikia sp.]|uniref:EH signature domain-containing protein n=1 Tax=Malikia sp. TaxID=2070706 RepID=UPI00261CFC9D|nr:EH signature domain-containing protein [Malikia sp.]MDD2729512.1 EH signature domain-containing protein [Malikia sp.]